MADRPQVRVFVAAKARAKDAGGEWQEYEGPRGGEGAINVQTGEIRYDVDPDAIGQDTESNGETDLSNPSNWADPWSEVSHSKNELVTELEATFGQDVTMEVRRVAQEMARLDSDSILVEVETGHLVEAFYQLWESEGGDADDMRNFQEILNPEERDFSEDAESDIPEHMNPAGRDVVVSLSEYLGSGGMNENAMSVAYNDGADGTPPLFITNTNPRKSEWRTTESDYASDHGAKVATMSSEIINDVFSGHSAPEHYHEEGEFLSVEGISGFPIENSSVVQEFPDKYGAAMGVQWLLANADAHGGNMFFREEENPEFVCIDLDQAMGIEPPDETGMDDGQPTDQTAQKHVNYLSGEFISSLREMDDGDAVDAAVDAYIESVETQAPKLREYIDQSSTAGELTRELKILDAQAKIAESGQFERIMRQDVEQLRADNGIVG